MIVDISEEMNTRFMQTCVFSVDGNTIKTGQLKLFIQKGVLMEFHLIAKNGVKIFEVPYPFKIERTADGYNFDYRFKSMYLPIREVDVKDMTEDDAKPFLYCNKILNIKIK